MRVGVDGRKIPEAAKRGPVASLDHGKEMGMGGLFFRTILDMSPDLDRGELRAIRQHADELDMYVETGLGKVNPFATPEAPELRAAGDGDILLGFRRMMEACAAIGCNELWAGTANYKSAYRGRFSYDRFRTDVTWPEQLEATRKFLLKLAPIARDLGVHINLETHEEITSFELVRLVESVGAEVIGIVFDAANGLQRGEHPVFVARRIAPYVRQTHIKDAYVANAPGGLDFQGRPCGQGVVDFRAILPILAKAKPDINLSIENPESEDDRPRSGSRALLEIYDSDWIAAHPDLTVSEYAAYMEMVVAYQARIDKGEVVDWTTYDSKPFRYAEAVAHIKDSAAYLRALCHELNLPIEPA
jgi:sugar phosphate isomerase/epimerase